MRTGLLTTIDLVIIGLYLLGLIGLGLWFSRRQKTTEDYFVAGRRMGWFVVGISVVVSLVSANSMLGAPGYVYAHDLQFMPIEWLVIVPIALFVVYAILPVFHALALTTAYTYLERRFGLSVRMLGSALFILLRGSWLAAVIYAPSIALSAVVDVPGLNEQQEIWLAVLVVGIVATIYTVLGGIEADMWSDIVQFFVLVGGLLLVGFYVLRDVGGWSEVWRIGSETGRTFPLRSAEEFGGWVFNPNLKATVEVMFLWAFLGQGVGLLRDAGTDQLTLQRYFSARSLKESTRGVWLAWMSDVPLMALLYLTGLGIFAYFHVHGAQFVGLPDNPDQMLPYFVAAVLPVGISGLFIAALFSATMSSVDSGINSLSAACITDFYRRLRGTEGTESSRTAFDKFIAALLAAVIAVVALAAMLSVPAIRGVVRQSGAASSIMMGVIGLAAVIVGLCAYAYLALPLMRRTFARLRPEAADEAHYLRASRYTTVAWGLLATVAGLFLGRFGQIYLIGAKIMGFWSGPLLGIFLLGILTRRANTKGVVIGAIVGVICTTIWAQLGFTPFMYGFIGGAATVVVGYLLSLVTERPRPEQIEGLTCYTRFPSEQE